MPRLLVKDFNPKLSEQQAGFSTLSLTSGLAGPTYQIFDELVKRANLWLAGNSRAALVSCQTIDVEGVYRNSDINQMPAHLAVLRLHLLEHDPAEVVPTQQIGFVDVLPERLEGSPAALGPKYERLSRSLQRFNQLLKSGKAHLPGRVLNAQTVTGRFSGLSCQLDPQRTFWMSAPGQDVHRLQYLRIFCIKSDSSPVELLHSHIGFCDFAPRYKRKNCGHGGGESSSRLLKRSRVWLQNNPQLLLVNFSTLDHTLYYKCLTQSLGDAEKVLDYPHNFESRGETVHHTHILRVFYWSALSVDLSPETSSASSPQSPLHLSSILLNSSQYRPSPDEAKQISDDRRQPSASPPSLRSGLDDADVPSSSSELQNVTLIESLNNQASIGTSFSSSTTGWSGARQDVDTIYCKTFHLPHISAPEHRVFVDSHDDELSLLPRSVSLDVHAGRSLRTSLSRSLSDGSPSVADAFPEAVLARVTSWLQRVSGSVIGIETTQTVCQKKKRASCDTTHSISYSGSSCPSVEAIRVYFRSERPLRDAALWAEPREVGRRQLCTVM